MGGFRAFLWNAETWEIIRSELGYDNADAVLAVIKDFRPPSAEGRKGRSGDPTDPRTSVTD
jgi:hypothetical protein